MFVNVCIYIHSLVGLYVYVYLYSIYTRNAFKGKYYIYTVFCLPTK